MDKITALLTHPIFLSAFVAWFLAQFIKALIQVFRFRNRMAKDVLVTLFWTTGGMPSSHSAVVSALTTAVGIKLGLDSPLFIVTLFFAFLAIRDALGVRRAAGLQARAINTILTEINSKFGTAYKPVKEINGHKAAEVSVGILLGVFLAVAFCSF